MKKTILSIIMIALLLTASACGVSVKKWDAGKMGGIAEPTGTITDVTRVEGGFKYSYSDMLYDDAAAFIETISSSEYSLNISTGVENNSLYYYGENPDGDRYGIVYSINDKTCTITYRQNGGSAE